MLSVRLFHQTAMSAALALQKLLTQQFFCGNCEFPNFACWYCPRSLRLTRLIYLSLTIIIF